MERDTNGFLKSRHDPAVEALLNQGDQRRNERAMPADQRRKAKKERNRQQERNGRRGVYDLDPELIKAFKAIAEENGTTASAVVGIALHTFLTLEVDLDLYKVRLEKNPRYEYDLVWKE